MEERSTYTKAKKMKKVMIIVFLLVVMFLGVNTYAATKGYNNIFFIIKNLVTHNYITEKNEILLDRDITISYQPIEITNDLKLQINKLIVKENEATLYLKVDEKRPISIYPKQYAVYDITNGKKDELGRQATTRSNDDENLEMTSYTEEIKLSKLKNETKELELEVFDNNGNEIISFKIDLKNKEIDILNSKGVELERISETELKSVLGLYARLARYDAFSDSDFYSSREEAAKERLVENAILLMIEKDGYQIREEGYSRQEVHDIIKEMCGKNINKPIKLKYSIIEYNKHNDRYEFMAGDGLDPALCLEIQNINFYDGIYTVDFVYCFASDDDYLNNAIENCDKFRTTMQLKINDNYKYAKYCLTNLDYLVGESYTEDSNYYINSVTNTLTNIANTTNTTNTIYNNTVTNIVTNTSKDNNYSNIIENNNYHNVNNYASTMRWNSYTSPGLNFIYPAEWNVEHVAESIRGNNPGGVATMITGVATGINKDTNTIINSNVSISIAEPRILEGYSSKEEYITELNNNRNNGEEPVGCETEKTGRWYDYYTDFGEDRVVYESIHIEKLSDGRLQEYSITISYDGEFNYKVINILNWFYGGLEIIEY